MLLRTLIIVAPLAFVMRVLSLRAEPVEPTRRMNVVLIMADDMGYETVGAYGGESYKTPNIDRLAQTGMRFNHAHSLPVCTPTRVQLLSGRYNSRNYIGFGKMAPDTYTIGNLMRDAGYKTFIGGKWQLGGDAQAPRHFGFDEWCVWQLTHSGGQNVPRYPNPGLEINGRYQRFTQGEYGPDVINDNVLRFIERHHNDEQPFFVYYPMILPHYPFEPTPDSADWDPTARRDDARERNPGGGDIKYLADMIAYTDKMVGNVVRQLDELGIRENTIIIFLGDNGTHRDARSRFNGRIVQGGKLNSTDNGTHVPMIANCPGFVPAGTVNDDLICFTSFFPTLAEIADHPLDAKHPIDGESILPLLRGEEHEARDWLYMWWSRNNKIQSPGDEFARTHRYKLYRDGRFYDLEQDLMERDAIPADRMTADQVRIRDRLRTIMDTYTRPDFFQQRGEHP